MGGAAAAGDIQHPYGLIMCKYRRSTIQIFKY